MENRQKNALAWYENANNSKFKGIVATGWNRYSTGQPQCEPLEAALDSLVSVGEILHSGEIGDYLKLLLDTNNMIRFENFKSSLHEFSIIRKRCWTNIQLLFEFCTLEQLEPLRGGSGRIEDYYKRLGPDLIQLKNISNKATKQFADLIERECLDMYFSERISAIENANKTLERELYNDME